MAWIIITKIEIHTQVRLIISFAITLIKSISIKHNHHWCYNIDFKIFVLQKIRNIFDGFFFFILFLFPNETVFVFLLGGLVELKGHVLPFLFFFWSVFQQNARWCGGEKELSGKIISFVWLKLIHPSKILLSCGMELLHISILQCYAEINRNILILKTMKCGYAICFLFIFAFMVKSLLLITIIST